MLGVKNIVSFSQTVKDSIKCMFDSAVRRIDFVESILTKNELKVK